MLKRLIPLAALLGATSLLQSALAAPQAIEAEALRALPDGGWLAQSKQALRVLDPQGRELSRLALPSEKLDLRQQGAQTTVAVVSRQDQTVRVLDLAEGRLRESARLPALGFAIDSLCLYRDRQALLHGFFIADSGQAEQWLLSGPSPRKLRQLALPPEVVGCAVDDARGELLLAEEKFGVWAYRADAEGKLQRRAVLQARPHGPLAGGSRAIASLAGGLAVLDGSGRQLYWLSANAQGWQQRAQKRLARAQADIASAQGGLLLQDEASERWQFQALPWQAGAASTSASLPFVTASAQTEPVARLGDAADDPAIWINPRDAAASRVLGTNKKQGLLVYDLAGRQTQLLEVGRLNNVDLRQRVRLGGQTLDLAVATHRDTLALAVFAVAADGVVSELGQVATGLADIYGLCLYQPSAGGLEVLVNDKDGRFRQYRLGLEQGAIQGRLLREFRLASQPEGCVADDAAARFFIGEEDRGIWTLPADADQPAKPQLIMAVGRQLQADVEGMALYLGTHGRYLVVSSQGNDSYVVLDAKPPFRYRGAFRVGIAAQAGIDGASETDGLDVSAAALPGFEQGLLVVQDGYKRLPDGPQNFKYIAWRDIAAALKLE